MSTFATPPTLTDDEILFLDREAAQTFFNAFALPDASTTSPGIVSQLDTVSYSFTPYTPVYFSYMVLNPDMTETQVQLPSKDDFDALQAQVNALGELVEELITNMKSAGIMQDA